MWKYSVREYKHRGWAWGEEACQEEVDAVMGPLLAFLDIEENPFSYHGLRWLHSSGCESMVECYVASNADVTLVPLLRRGSSQEVL